MSIPFARIIIAEDQKSYRDLLTKELREEYKIETIAEAQNGKELVELLDQLRPDAVLLDIEMPVMDGHKAFNIIRSKWPHLKIIFLSFYDKLKCYYLKQGANGFLSKNDDVSSIASAIINVKQNGYYEIEITQSEFLGKQVRFSEREDEIISLLLNGKTIKETANKLSISPKTVETHRKNIFDKTNSRFSADLIRYIVDNGLKFSYLK